ncbi:cupin domain-containing protein [Actinoplanes sichuanensis]|uniref:Cupin domain-containing protein n=1 Tax=Actinoplanes sichuanensis TaxID=512349 RepID=A0ABW4A8Y9_9ACTN|nr:cupin domain-containing protein [Actinoplanes sichuanensis]BEL06344.1 cupin domain-containing protein [Actinoplanes sichuanensis]
MKSRTLTGGILVTAMMAVGSPALATPPGPGMTATVIRKVTAGGTDWILREITIPPGQATGWHWHSGKVSGLVKQGTLSHFGADCKSDGVYQTGGVIQEESGPGYVHIGVNRGTVPLILEVLYVQPTGAPFANDAPNPGCDFQ